MEEIKSSEETLSTSDEELSWDEALANFGSGEPAKLIHNPQSKIPHGQYQLSLWEKICGIFIWIGQMLKPN